jgi:hypothetical protein
MVLINTDELDFRAPFFYSLALVFEAIIVRYLLAAAPSHATT